MIPTQMTDVPTVVELCSVDEATMFLLERRNLAGTSTAAARAAARDKAARIMRDGFETAARLRAQLPEHLVILGSPRRSADGVPLGRLVSSRGMTR